MTHLTVPHIQHVALVLYSARTKTMSSPQCLTARGSGTQPGPELWVHHITLHHVAVVLSPDQNYGFTTVPLHHVAVELSPDQNYGFGTHICRWKSLYPAWDIFLAEQLLGCMA